LYFDLVKAAKEPSRHHLAFRLYEHYRKTGKQRYLLGAFRYSLPIVAICFGEKLKLERQDWEDVLSICATELYYGWLMKAHWTRLSGPEAYFQAVYRVAYSRAVNALKKTIYQRPLPKIPPSEWMLYGVNGVPEHPSECLARIYKGEVLVYIRKRVPELVRCRRKERKVISVLLDRILDGTLKVLHHGNGAISTSFRFNGSVEQSRRKLLIDRISLCCRRAMYELEDDGKRFDGLSVKGVLKGMLRKTWQPSPS